MLGVRQYTREYFEGCRARVEADVLAYEKMVAGGGVEAAGEEFEATFFNNMVILLDAYFVHRLRTVEGKDGNARNEVRVLCQSMLNHGNVLTADKAIHLSPAKSVLKYEYGNEIRVTEADFLRLSQAFFPEIESKYL